MIKVCACSHKVLRKLGSSSPRGESGGSVRSVLQFQTELAVPEVDKTRDLQILCSVCLALLPCQSNCRESSVESHVTRVTVSTLLHSSLWVFVLRVSSSFSFLPEDPKLLPSS